jgi:hypothetical protein
MPNQNPPAHTLLLRFFLHRDGLPPAPPGRNLDAIIQRTIIDRFVGRPLAEVFPGGSATLRGIDGGYTIASDGRVVAALVEGGVCVGAVVHPNLYVDPAHRGRSIGPELMLSAWDAGVLSNDLGSYSAAGEVNRIRAHHIAVGRAIQAGEAVPQAVLEEHRGGEHGRRVAMLSGK